MESEILDNAMNEQGTLTISNLSRSYLNQIRRWAKFFAILSFIMIGLLVVFALFFGTIMGTLMSSMPMGGSGLGALGGGAVSFIYLLIAGISIIPTLYLNRFANKLKVALETESSEQLQYSFENLKSFSKFIGILYIIVLAIYALLIVFAIIGGIASLMM